MLTSIALAPPTHKPTNVLLLLHGLGDTNIPFGLFAQRLSLPETCCISLRAPAPLPFGLEGYHWGDDIVFDNATGGIDTDSGFTRALKLVHEKVVKGILIDKCGYKGREIVLFGFGQGGMVAISLAKELGDKELGGVVSIGGALPASLAITAEGKKSKTPIIVCKGNSNSALKDKDVQRLKDSFEYLELKEWKKNGDGMPASREEMLPIMQFFARRLRSVRGVPSGSVELS
jgi:predicted esterase